MHTQPSKLFEATTDELLDELERRSPNFILSIDRPLKRNRPRFHLRAGGEKQKIYEMLMSLIEYLE